MKLLLYLLGFIQLFLMFFNDFLSLKFETLIKVVIQNWIALLPLKKFSTHLIYLF